MNLGNRSTFGRGDTGAWLDNEPGSFVGFWLVEEQEGGFKGSIMDFGPDFRISVNKFGFQARSGFSDRLAGMQVFGSNDRQNWTQLTVAEFNSGDTGRSPFTASFRAVSSPEKSASLPLSNAALTAVNA